jgi:cytochrome c oxidase cbb3-type subunit III
MNQFNPSTHLKQAKWIATLLLVLFASSSFAQGGGSDTMLTVIVVVSALVAILLLAAIYALQVLTKLLRSEERRKAKESGTVAKPVLSFWQLLLKVANRRVDIEEEESIILDHDYDGIKELDNHLPPWWSYLFYLTIIFAVVYVVVYHFTESLPLQEEEYAIEMAEANAENQVRMAESEAAGTSFSESNLQLTTDPDILASGSKVFAQQCVACHRADAGGSIGPNLTDGYWIHGGDIKSVFNIIKVGVLDKGMMAWEGVLSPTQIRDVANYIISLKGSNPPSPKAPQGELYGEGAENTAPPTEAATEVIAEKPAAEGDVGKSVFEMNCVACHTADGGGVMGLGPNLTDKYWKDSDGSREGILNTITNGVAGTAMTPWKGILDDAQLEAVVKYVIDFQGTTPVNPKAPEGDLYE